MNYQFMILQELVKATKSSTVYIALLPNFTAITINQMIENVYNIIGKTAAFNAKYC